ncbi:hypothetical protein [Mesorhizobium loti]|uniref:hypothetical protein n=1 Tax=Rhizobium loti TaxID=381 RepID=UPI00047BD8F4|nr:hypothetical protein [Mesorhizobium loti]
MIAIAKIAGILSVAIGAICLVVGIFDSRQFGTTVMFPPVWAMGLSSIVSGAVLYCVGEIAEKLKEAVDHLASLRRHTEGAAPRSTVSPSRQQSLADLEGIKGVFQDR